MNKKAIAIQTLCNIGGIAIFKIKYGIEDKILSAFWNGDKYDKATWATIKDDDNGLYFIRFGCKYYLNDFIKI